MTNAAREEDEVPPLHVLLCPDQPSWAFDNIANNITRFAGVNSVSRLYTRDIIENERIIYETILLKRIDLCHVFWREDLFYLLHPHTINKGAQSLGLDYETLVRAINSCAFTTSVYDHLFSNSPEIQERRSSFAMIDGYTVSSNRLRDIYAREPDIPAPDVVISDGVDLDHFRPADSPQHSGTTFVLGWVGNSAWGSQTEGLDVKGYNRIFQPMIADLTARGLAVEAKVADPKINRVSFNEMPDFYRRLDVFACTSRMEGTPNPVLEAMACGIPIVSTDVGIVPEAFGELQSRFIITDSSPLSFADAVAELLGNQALRKAIAEENRGQAQKWSWETRTREWWPFWQRVMIRTMQQRNGIRRELYLRSLVNFL